MNWNFRIGFVLVTILVLVALLAPWISPHDPNAFFLDQQFLGPHRGFWLGHDAEGRCLASRAFFGARISLTIAVVVVFVSGLVGLLVGVVAGLVGKLVDSSFLIVSEILLAFPGFLLAIAVAAFLRPSFWNVILILSMVGWVGYARLARGQVLAVKERQYIKAALSIGVPTGRLIYKHLIPRLAGPFLVQATFGMAGVILVESALSFLGIGVPVGTPSWGGMLDQGTQYLLIAPHMALFPGLFIMAVVLGFNFLGDGLRDRLDPRHRTEGIP